MNKVLIVTNEIYPLDRGGIARLAYNFARDNRRRGAPAQLHFLLPASCRPKARHVEAEFQGLATIHFCSESLRPLGPLGRLIQQFGPRDSIDFHMVESLRYLAGILDAQRELGLEFDVLEFPDFNGWGAAAIAAKRSGLALANALIAIRLHSCFGLIVDHEPFMHEPSDWLAAVYDLERQALLGADLVVGHLASTATLNGEHFALGKEWTKKVRIEMPPITLTEIETQAVEVPEGADESGSDSRDFLFSSRLQGFKRPDLFIRAAVHFLDHYDDARSVFRIAAYGWDRDYIDWLKRLVPARWRRQIVFLDDVPARRRAQLMRESILVIPSDFESLCLLAYEGRQLGLKLILNRRCRAFGSEQQFWREGTDCLFFDGDFISLAETMRKALDWEPAAPRPLPVAAPYWETPAASLRAHECAAVEPLSVSYVLYGTADLEILGQRIGELQLSFGLSEIHVLVACEAFDAAEVAAAAWQVRGVTVHMTGWNEPTPSEVEATVRKLDSGAVAFLPIGMDVEQGFWAMAAERLALWPEAAIFTSHVAHDDPDDARRFTLNCGQAPTVALLTDRVAHRASVFRRDVLLEFGLREQAGERWHEDLCMRLIAARRSVIVAPALLARSRGKRRQSRIPSLRFFATHRDEAGRRLGAAYRQGSAGTPYIDSIETIDHAAWIARHEPTKPPAADQHDPAKLHFRNVVLKNRSTGEDGSSAELEIALEGVSVGSVSIDWMAFKILRYTGEAQLEFRDSGNARRYFREWPPPTSDKWGSVAVWSSNPLPHPHRVFFERAGDHDSQRLKLLLQHLPGIVRLLPLPERERAQWQRVAKALQSPG